MKVASDKPFEIVYSLFNHELLGILFESFAIQLDEKGRLSFAYQNISYQNAREFGEGLDDTDLELIKLMDSMQQEAIVKKYNVKNTKPKEFLRKVFDKDHVTQSNKEVQKLIEGKLEITRAKILDKIQNKRLFEMGNDGNPVWKEIAIMPEKASVLFHFRRNEENTHYFPTIKYQGEKLEWQYKGSYLICHQPAWLVVDSMLVSFEKAVDGKKLRPFLNKRFIVIPRKVEDSYYRKFVTQLVASFDVYAKGFEIKVARDNPEPVLYLGELPRNPTVDMFGKKIADEDEEKMVFDLRYHYGDYSFRADQVKPTNVEIEKIGDEYVFYKVVRNLKKESFYGDFLKNNGLAVRVGRQSMPKREAYDWIINNRPQLEDLGIKIKQTTSDSGKKYFMGTAKISVNIKEKIDWFDVEAVISFGDYEISFQKFKKLLLKGKSEIELPNKEVGIIPKSWFVNYGEIFSFIEDEQNEDGKYKLKKHHIALAQELEKGNLLKLGLSERLNKLKDFSTIDDYELSSYFKGTLRPYQKAGYNWMRFLNEYNFGGCLADDMGLGKTVQTLALLAMEKERSEGTTSLLVMPTSLIYNWELEARKFTPKLKILIYTGTQRIKDCRLFERYDLVLTSYGITRLDINILNEFYFNYIILDESQAIKNPDSIISKAVIQLKSNHKLILTGTPVENGTMDLWSQMNFINRGLLAGQTAFKKQFLLPIEKKNDKDKILKLNAMIKPFILRRLKSQVATDLPEKVVNVKYSSMTPDQEQAYEDVKNYFREKIIDEASMLGKSQKSLTLLRGLTQLRQMANHPKMADDNYAGDSGKLEDISHMVKSTVSEGHKVLIFSQFVKHLGIVKEFLKDEKIPFAYLDGATVDRQKEVASFQENPNIKVFLISLKAGGVGLNLTKAEYVFMLDPWWNPAVEAQAIDRAHRIGQKNKVIIYKFITRNSVEEKIMELQERKMALAGELISTEESFIKSLNQEDIVALLD
ncbi:DEAD/DEAH box helicase [Cyclobacterium marinum]|uniref:SNF2-related protein n=1 Tax=Cyclobacterium marinum (strain ATCC 25205 / DSM 745 / LMG 13164 / NCIMB 1802) TaxID=880070 RepID=G0IWV0_CYCMS|nr:DEAD/DEAH box helicase [Cyclobacterium marinum]AEL24868.1 SNF2-related protein [Cyclobacterium marinum DSM 745]